MITACFIVIPTTENSEYFFFLKSQEVATDHHFQQKACLMIGLLFNMIALISIMTNKTNYINISLTSH